MKDYNLYPGSQASLVAGLSLAVWLAGCNPPAPPPPPLPAPASQPAPAAAAQREDPQALATLAQAQSRYAAIEPSANHAQLLQAADALDQLPLRLAENVRQRDELARKLRAAAATIRDALHRYLFAQLEPLPEAQRKGLLDAADRGDSDAVTQAAAALADHEFAAGKKRFRTVVPATPGSPVRSAFDAAFNARLRQAILATQPAEKP